MTKILRLGFVMGGGVSLGSFSAGALSESLKQLILFAQYETSERDANGKPICKPYDQVEIDVFSGASAGAMSLAIMLRALANPRDKFKSLGFESYDLMRASLEQRLFIQFGEPAYLLKQTNPAKFESLLAVQTMQDMQTKLWTDEVSLDKLLGTGKAYKDLTDEAGIVDRDVVDEVARKYFQFGQVGERLKYRSHLLGNRVLFACTLANLNYTLTANIDKSSVAGENPNFLKALNDSSIDKVHSEVRVFDINFRPIPQEEAPYYPLKWVQYHQADDILIEQTDKNGTAYAKFIRNLDKSEVWREMAATTIASGAFPFAFEPVVLNRYRHEYAENWSSELQHLTKYPFTYVDGGMFNNEPIREAFRLAAYLDNQTNDKIDFDRHIIFVDPNVSDLESQFRVNVHSRLNLGKSILSGKASVATKSTVLRLASKVPHLLSAILHEARHAESGRIAKTMENFEWREVQRKFYRSALAATMPDADIVALREMVKTKLDAVRQALEYPKNTLQIQHELLRVAREEAEFVREFIPVHDHAQFIEKVNEFVYIPTPSLLPNVKYWLYLLTCLSLDISLNFVGKTHRAKLIPIAPFDFYKNDYNLLSLPGAGMAGFAGFASAQVSGYEIRYGQYCAYRILSELKIIRPDAPAYPIPTAFDYNLFNDILKKDVEIAFIKRIKEMLPSGLNTSLVPFVDSFIHDKVRQFVHNHIITHKNNRTFEFRIRVPQDLYTLRGFDAFGSVSNKNNLETVKVNGEYFLVTQLSYNIHAKKWSGANVNSLQLLYIDKLGILSNSPSVGIELPAITQEAILSPNPIFILDASIEAKYSSFLEIKSDKWVFYSEVAPLDETLWGEDKIRNLYEKL